MYSTLKAYPNSTKSGESIPFDVAQPLGCFLLNVAPDQPLLINQLPVAPILSISNQQPTVLVFSPAAVPPPITGGNYQEHTVYCPPGTILLAAPSIRRVWVYNLGDEDDLVAIQLLASWNSLGTTEQLTRI